MSLAGERLACSDARQAGSPGVMRLRAIMAHIDDSTA